MKEGYHKKYSPVLNRDMEYLVYGEEGKVCIAFPPQNGRFYDFKDFGMIEAVKPWINAGKIRVICPDSIDKETWSDENGDPKYRINLHEKWFHYIIDELLKEYLKENEKGIVTGCSMGGVHAGNFFFRRPDLFDTMISLSGLFNAQYFFRDYTDELVYNNSPVHFLLNMPHYHPWMNLYKQSRIIACVGQGAWEEDLLYGTRELDTILAKKGIPHKFDYWGYDVSHDWYWWKKQITYFLGHII